jgi:hypothetical protein
VHVGNGHEQRLDRTSRRLPVGPRESERRIVPALRERLDLQLSQAMSSKGPKSAGLPGPEMGAGLEHVPPN